jgi:hypothetical protein
MNVITIHDLVIVVLLVKKTIASLFYIVLNCTSEFYSQEAIQCFSLAPHLPQLVVIRLNSAGG